ncbi:glycoside hydrolase family 3 N-terminal domain-containing protein [Paenibacillus sp. MMS20-IR301]|uniref:glycoside hydrolase family 3 protein n=1 Tax=Paenibacillus sp. MMS20-IR301 TaxID=2895946 RepID=UPI0028F0E2AE|nr:glycoside hydrolase family 3 N-terminal domain-containing protein [Paenibacillus sp. MMS20-IR301]WNS44122.1 glycoside hydrolase family 3 N-terminal domain-containing protein [Paenibacillus sp. MMS20-IR301]
MQHLKEKPFCLSDEDISWVAETLDSLTEEEKIGQLFCLVSYTSDEDYLGSLARKYKAGGLMCRPMPAAETVDTVRILQENSRIPMLIAANLERGGTGIAAEGTTIGSVMQVAATDEEEMAYKLGSVCGQEGAAVGCNWAFAPIIDIDYNFRNPITNTRTFGSDPERVRRMGVQYIKGVQENNVAASIKHFPGDGMDERDQHLVTSINSLTCEQWDATYGEVYKSCIEAGAMTVMIGHIMQPAYSRRLNPALKDEELLPASLSYELTTTLLKERLGFNGLVVTDASTMAGMTIPMSRAQAVPQAIAAGCDMFLFTRNLEEDYMYMKKGIEDGIITRERLDDALVRILGLKASLRLHRKQAAGELVPSLEAAKEVLGAPLHKVWAAECADKAVTLVKEEAGVLPVTPNRYRRILYYDIEAAEGVAYSVRTGVADMFRKLLAGEGFEVTQYLPPQGREGMLAKQEDITGQYDLIIYLANMSTKSNQTAVRIEWAQPMGANVPVYINTVPTIFISVENPYHLLDVPRVKTFINAYNSNDHVLKAIIDKLMGRSAFTGTSPVDPFCGMWDTRL